MNTKIYKIAREIKKLCIALNNINNSIGMIVSNYQSDLIQKKTKSDETGCSIGKDKFMQVSICDIEEGRSI
jgi:hypothetical protein